ncbi:acyltransferase family protein [Xenorhabdus bovienii]|uniref:Putative acyltransferase n=1 Tax=Xenorhabdus bovienii TaxID=40576 RepID=A0A0B6XDN0_XENBV|nr:acyltransferase family protein [Xenorhabdus bovienii]CDM90379.1 putative acyltransferase [Xenorhabdus bovienii]
MNRNLYIDYMKAIGIIFVVAGHYNSAFFSIMNPYYFHMPLFFMIAGLTIKNERSETVKKTLKKIFNISIYIAYTYVIIGILALILFKFTGVKFGFPFINNPIETIIVTYKNGFYNNSLFRVGWFLVAYMTAYVLTIITIIILKKKMILLAISILYGIVAVNNIAEIFLATRYSYLNILTQTLFGSMFMIFGYLSKDVLVKINNIYIMIVSIMLLYVMKDSGVLHPTIMVWSSYKSGFVISTISALLGIIIISYISSLLSKDNDMKFLSILGRESREIMSYHLFFLVIVDVILSITNNLSMDKITAIDHFRPYYGFPIYMIAGLFGPIAIVLIKNKLMSLVRIPLHQR